MTIKRIVQERGIEEVLHFTTNSGLVGIFAARALKARRRLSSDKYLEHIYRGNCPDRSRDTAWHDYVSLSISSINGHLFNISSGKWHKEMDGWWCVLSFIPTILEHDGVYFTTTNNAYDPQYGGCVVRGTGPEGLNRLFADRIRQWPTKSVIIRCSDTPNNQPTCKQAEVLYPGQIGLEFLQNVYVKDDSHIAEIHGICAALYQSKPPECNVSWRHFQ